MELDINLSLKKKKNPSYWKAFLEARGYNTSLPFCILSESGDVYYASSRLLARLSLGDVIAFPILKKDFSNHWLFHNDEMAGPAIYSKVLAGISKKNPLVAQLGNQSFHIYSIWDAEEKVSLVFVELIRRGDLLRDKESRQLLFRVLSHELRTSVSVLKGYVSMVEFQEKMVEDRIWSSLDRLDKVVDMLKDLKTELEVDEGNSKKVA